MTFFRQIVLLALFLVLILSVAPQNSSYTLGPNLTVNGDLQQIPLTGSYYNSPSPYTSWTSYHRIQVSKPCAWMGSYPNCPSVAHLNCPNQSINLDSTSYNEIVTNSIYLNSTNLYQISFSYFVIKIKPLSQINGFNLYLNDTLISQNYINNCTLINQQWFIKGRIGMLRITFESLGTPDGTGVNIDNLKVMEVLYDTSVSQQTLIEAKVSYYSNILFQTSFGVITQSIFNQNAFSRILLGYAIQINHLPLYLYHNRNYSISAQSFLIIFQNFENLKQALPQKYVYPFEKIDIQWVNSVCASKYTFSDYALFQKAENDQNCLFGEVVMFSAYDLQITILIVILAKVILCFVKNKKFRSIMQVYNLHGYLLLMIFDGKIENLTFYFFVELQIFNSPNLKLKLINTLAILTFFLALWILHSIYFLYFAIYRQKAKKLFQENTVTIEGCFFLMINMVLLNAVSGFLHIFLVKTPQFQALMLACVELLRIFTIYYCLIQKIAKSKILNVSQILLAFLRIFLIFFFVISNRWYIYHLDGFLILDQIQEFMFIAYIAIYLIAHILEIIKQIFLVGYSIFKVKSHKIGDLPTNIHQKKLKKNVKLETAITIKEQEVLTSKKHEEQRKMVAINATNTNLCKPRRRKGIPKMRIYLQKAMPNNKEASMQAY